VAPMVEIRRLWCNSLLVDWPQGHQHGNFMDETTLLALQLREDNLRDDLTMLCGDLKKNGYDFTPLLTDAGPASHDLVQRLTAQIKSLQERLRLTHERPFPDVIRLAVNTETVTRKRRQACLAEDDGVLPRKGKFAAFANCRVETIQEAEKVGTWAFHVVQTYSETVLDLKDGWRRHWDLSTHFSDVEDQWHERPACRP
jgi:hypothetical protein